MPRSLAHSAGAAVIILASALTSAAPVAAHSAAPSDGYENRRSQCYTSNTQRQGLESIVWSVLFGPQNNTTETRCDGDEAKEKQEKSPGFLRSLPAS
ncbi:MULTISPECIES: hypothetical protein [Streptomyces]|uniref:Secreted protein n=1 Tax=Streptomyces koelreuteriae TaxID=2838015 RepID=A0ABX8FV54_9ACTN|nr:MULTISPECIES: hypothetical protein [Streptomyces]QWB24885.1 hypothetical protein KJK29_21140 [Streptomyces koelreuteriae]UUA07901.1 hypothetical protein NNW98_21265 [Streptomyces koelreuteriae]UUA15530.1 hypothetical protein NNW99_21260 [Streptomyces sp. CRCS-T-1]